MTLGVLKSWFLCPSTTEKFVNSHNSKVTAWKVVNSNRVDPMTGRTLRGGWNNNGEVPIFLNRNYARKFKNENEKVIRCEVLPRDIVGVTRTKDEAVVKKVFVPKSSLVGKSE